MADGSPSPGATTYRCCACGIGYLSPAASSIKEKMKDLEAVGFLRLGKGIVRRRKPIIVNSGTAQVSDLLIEDRR